ncbi:SIS domain-containing protein [Mollicutes bacterium LVI A0039]|nr:SIS domain-containing protein [Mollicutes bacterium LVI A0039]
MKKNIFVDLILDLIPGVVEEQDENIDKAALCVKESITKGGLLLAFGSGHSYGNAIEICGRAGGLIPSKLIEEPSRGIYEMVEGVGEQFVKRTDIRENDVVVLISNSGRNPLSIEIAEFAQKQGAKIIVLTALAVSKTLTSRHSNGKLLYEYADVVLDNMGEYGDAAITIEGLETPTGGTSSIIGNILLDEMMIRALQLMIEEGYTPPIFMSANIDGGPEFNQVLLDQYAERLYRF